MRLTGTVSPNGSDNGVRVRLNGVAAPERNEPGGAEATATMTQMTSGKTVRCSLTGKKSYKREFGTCWIGSRDLGAALIAAGKAAIARDIVPVFTPALNRNQ